MNFIFFLYRELRSLTKECHAAKLFSKHMKVEEQVLNQEFLCNVKLQIEFLYLRLFDTYINLGSSYIISVRSSKWASEFRYNKGVFIHVV